MQTEIKYSPILFSTAMVQAILAGNKTMTRRVVKLQPLHFESAVPMPCPVMEFGKHVKELAERNLTDIHTSGAAKGYILPVCPYGQVGDRLWVQESWMRTSPHNAIWYKASFPNDFDFKARGLRVRPSIHMPRAACRLVLEITGIRVERLHDISEADAIAEGVKWNLGPIQNGYGVDGSTTHINPTTCFQDLWQSIKGRDSWAANLWVWVVEFKVVEGGNNG